jgi:hypothetical protein
MNLKKTRLILTSIMLLITANTFCQKIEGVDFKNYPAKLSNEKKAKLNIKSNILGTKFGTAIKYSYPKKNVDFAGHYIAIYWGAGAGSTGGALVDTKDGKIYDLPLTYENSYRGSWSYNDNNENIKHFKDSFLYMCYTTNQIENKIDITYFFYLFDEKTKKFNLKFKKSKKVIAESDKN